MISVIVAAPRVERGAAAWPHLVGVDHRLAGEVPALFGNDLVLELDRVRAARSSTRTVRRTLSVAEPGVGVDDERSSTASSIAATWSTSSSSVTSPMSGTPNGDWPPPRP